MCIRDRFSTDGYSVADDVASNQVVVFGGDLSLDQTWVWNGRVGSSYIRGRALQGARRPPWHTTRNCTTERPGFVGQGIATMPPTRYGGVGLSQRVVSGCRGTSNAKDPEVLRCCRADRVRCRQHQRRFGIGRKPVSYTHLDVYKRQQSQRCRRSASIRWSATARSRAQKWPPA